MKTSAWKKGRGNLGPIAPLIGYWKAATDSPMGPVTCIRHFSPILGGKYIQLTATWQFKDNAYEELAVIGMDNGRLAFWSFTSDGKRSTGYLADASDIHPEAICFEAEMPAGLARMIYWPGENGGFNWAVESRNKKGWNRFTQHHYLPEEPPPSA